MNADSRPGVSVETRVVAYDAGIAQGKFDRLATEEPLEIRVRAGAQTRSVALTMRTPGNDFELAAGFLYAEGVIDGFNGLRGISYCLDAQIDADQRYNIVNVDLAATVLPDLDTLERHFLTTSACGVCGRASLEALRDRGLQPITSDIHVEPATLAALPDRLRASQRVFDATGGLHAAALFDATGTCIAVREDVGRHNALDKLVGWALVERRLPLDDHLVMVSGRASYELVQKAVAARVAVVCSVSAPSSLAVDLAREFDVTLVGFLRGARFNVYAGERRIVATVTS
jgi:FdhD protein